VPAWPLAVDNYELVIMVVPGTGPYPHVDRPGPAGLVPRRTAPCPEVQMADAIPRSALDKARPVRRCRLNLRVHVHPTGASACARVSHPVVPRCPSRGVQARLFSRRGAFRPSTTGPLSGLSRTRAPKKGVLALGLGTSGTTTQGDEVDSMIRRTGQLGLAASAMAMTALGVVAIAGPASAEPGPGRDYAQHVVEHHGQFSGTHNPGVMHRGFSGWQEHVEEHVMEHHG
jgi:hypothetical protein